MTATPQLASSNSSFSRSSHLELFCKKCVLRNFAKFTGKHLCQSLFFNKIVGLACNLIKKETLAQVFSCEFCEVSKNTFPYRTPPVAPSGFISFSFSGERNVSLDTLSCFIGMRIVLYVMHMVKKKAFYSKHVFRRYRR